MKNIQEHAFGNTPNHYYSDFSYLDIFEVKHLGEWWVKGNRFQDGEIIPVLGKAASLEEAQRIALKLLNGINSSFDL